jgi:hypothetical protein
MTTDRRKELKAEIDKRARERARHLDRVHRELDYSLAAAFGVTDEVFDAEARELMRDANLGLAIGAADIEGKVQS